ncbi:hypothetical protein ACS0TY_005163 [Phlomoides rotata]
MDTNLKEKEVLIDIENREGSPGAHVPSSGGKRENASLKRLVSGILSFDEEHPHETTKLLADRNRGGEGNVPLVGKENETENENERRKGWKVKKAAKPPRPPKGPTLDAADMRLLKEITKIAKRKQERMERIKAIKKMKAAKALSASSSSSSSLASSTATISAMFITGVFFLVIILQALVSSTSSNVTLEGTPQQPPETTGLTPIEFYKTVVSDDGAAPSFLPPKSAG